MSIKIKKGDIVLLGGTSYDETGVKKIHRRLGKVIEVGKYDIFASLLAQGDFNRPFRIPIKRCQKVEVQTGDLTSMVKNAKIGNLVMSITSYFGKIEQHVGTVKRIIEKPGDHKQAVILSSTKEHTVHYDSLIVLEE